MAQEVLDGLLVLPEKLLHAVPFVSMDHKYEIKSLVKGGCDWID